MTGSLGEVAAGLRARRAELTAELDRLAAPPEEGAAVSFGKRIGDGTTEAVERLSTTAAARSLAQTIADIDRALQRIDEGVYGVCERCGSRIPEARLEALPASTLCVSCAAGN